MRKIILYILFYAPLVLLAKTQNYYPIVYPDVWLRADTLISIPSEDSISRTDDYTVFSVVRSLYKDSTECLWSLVEDDTVISAVLTDGVFLRSTGILHSRTSNDFSKWCIYAYHSGIRMDSTKNHVLRLGEQIVPSQHSTEMVSDTLHAQIESEEFAYFGSRVPLLTSAKFQTYLALKYGITLDNAPYVSCLGDTLWHPIDDENYYHRVIGIGYDTIYGWKSLRSRSKEDIAMIIMADSLMPNEYVLVGDDDGEREWRYETIGEFSLQRHWRMRSHTRHLLHTCAIVALPSAATNVRMTVRSEIDGHILTIYPDSIHGDSTCYFTLTNLDSISQLSISGLVLDSSRNRDYGWNDTDSGNSNISYNAQTGTITIDGYPEDQLFDLYLYSATGQYISTLTSRNPVNVSIFPQTVAYIEITTDNQLVGAIPLSINIH